MCERFHIGWGGERNTFYKGVEPSLKQTRFKILERKFERESSKRTIPARGGLGRLQTISEPDIRRCASEEAEPRRGMDMRQCASKDIGPK